MNGSGGNGNGSAIDTLGVAFSVTNSTFTGDLGLSSAGGAGLQVQPYTDNGYAGGANGTINIGSPVASSSFTFSGDTFSGEQAVEALAQQLRAGFLDLRRRGRRHRTSSTMSTVYPI